jgi:hypothetical protein
MVPIFAAALAIFLSGLSSKMLDGFSIGKSVKEIAYFAANAILVSIGAVAAIAVAPEIIVSLLIALPLMNKIDKLPLQAAYIAVLAITVLFIGDFSPLNPLVVAALAIGAAIDETELPFIRDFRPAMLAASLMIGIAVANWGPLLAIALFDMGYAVAARFKPDALRIIFADASKA